VFLQQGDGTGWLGGNQPHGKMASALLSDDVC